MGTAATGRQVTISFMNFDGFAEGMLIEHRAEADMLGLMQQLEVSANVSIDAS